MDNSQQKISIIIPCLNEAANIKHSLEQLQHYRGVGHEIIVVDGGSEDGTLSLCEGLADSIIKSSKGRATQLNMGASIAQCDVFLFLHADTVLPPGAITTISEFASIHACWGRFDVRLSGKQYLLRIIEFLMNWRSRFTGIATGDQAIFMSRELYQQVGGYPEIELMEDISISSSLRQISKPVCIQSPVITSSRRWEEKGIIRTMMLMHMLRLRFALGADPARLAKTYG